MPPLPEDHTVWQSALRAPFEPETDAERDAVAAAKNSGPPIPHAEVMEKLDARTRAEG